MAQQLAQGDGWLRRLGILRRLGVGLEHLHAREPGDDVRQRIIQGKASLLEEHHGGDRGDDLGVGKHPVDGIGAQRPPALQVHITASVAVHRRGALQHHGVAAGNDLAIYIVPHALVDRAEISFFGHAPSQLTKAAILR